MQWWYEIRNQLKEEIHKYVEITCKFNEQLMGQQKLKREQNTLRQIKMEI